jgi:hypothetical protein
MTGPRARLLERLPFLDAGAIVEIRERMTKPSQLFGDGGK